MTRRYLISASLLGALGIAPAARAQYAVIGLGTLGGATSTAYAINNNGEIVGSSTTASNATHAFVFANGVMTDLLPDSVSSTAFGLNDLGQIVGSENINGLRSNAFEYSDGSVTNLSPFLGPSDSAARGINSSGEVVGDYQGNNDASKGGYVDGTAFVLNGNVFTPINKFPGDIPAVGVANAINNSGQVVGELSGNAFLWQAGSTLADLTAEETGTGVETARLISQAHAINDNGLVVGESETPAVASPTFPFMWNDGAAAVVGTPPEIGPTGADYEDAGIAYGVNDLGVIVGRSASFDSPTYHAFVDSDGTFTDLNTLIPANSGWVLNSAMGINDVGTIVGYGTFDGQTEAFELVVPEPVSMAMIAAAAVPLLARRRRTRQA